MVNYRPRLVEEVKKHRGKEILVKHIMLRVFTSFTEGMDVNDASNTLVQKNISGAPVMNDANEAVCRMAQAEW